MGWGAAFVSGRKGSPGHLRAPKLGLRPFGLVEAAVYPPPEKAVAEQPLEPEAQPITAQEATWGLTATVPWRVPSRYRVAADAHYP